MEKKLSGRGGDVISVGVYVILIMYNVVTGSRWPVITVWWVSLSYMVTWLVSNTVMQLLSQSVPIDMNGLARCGNMWESLATPSRFVCGRSAIWVEEMMSPLDKVMGMGWFSLVLLTHRVSVAM